MSASNNSPSCENCNQMPGLCSCETTTEGCIHTEPNHRLDVDFKTYIQNALIKYSDHFNVNLGEATDLLIEHLQELNAPMVDDRSHRDEESDCHQGDY